ncbi:hypothetical protein TRVA0_074S00232 [Trichomonascus vanleenenianus]|uniref:RNA recognition motif domain-containing protein n=1 Tax=Trichomonascus vanleenenianus TaxID=2268995 RepID=UPI003EC9893A
MASDSTVPKRKEPLVVSSHVSRPREEPRYPPFYSNPASGEQTPDPVFAMPPPFRDNRDYTLMLTNYSPCSSWRVIRDRVLRITPGLRVVHVRTVNPITAIVQAKGFDQVVAFISAVNSHDTGNGVAERMFAALVNFDRPPPMHHLYNNYHQHHYNGASSSSGIPSPMVPNDAPLAAVPQEQQPDTAESSGSNNNNNNSTPRESGGPSGSGTPKMTAMPLPPLPHMLGHPPTLPPPPPPHAAHPSGPMHAPPHAPHPMGLPPFGAAMPPPQFNHHPMGPPLGPPPPQLAMPPQQPNSLSYIHVVTPAGEYVTIPVINSDLLPRPLHSHSTPGAGRRLNSATEKQVCYIGNIPFNTQWQDLKDFLRTGAAIYHVEVPLNEENMPRGYAIATFFTEEDAANAIRLFDGAQFNGRELRVRYNERPSKRTNHGDANGAATEKLQSP